MINLFALFPADTTAPDLDYPYGSTKNETAPGNMPGLLKSEKHQRVVPVR